MLRIYQAAIAHRTLLKALFLGVIMASVVLGFSGDASADDGVDP